MSPVPKGARVAEAQATQLWRRFCRKHLRPLYRVRGVLNIYDGTDHVIKIFYIFTFYLAERTTIFLSTSESYYNIEFVFL